MALVTILLIVVATWVAVLVVVVAMCRAAAKSDSGAQLLPQQDVAPNLAAASERQSRRSLIAH